MTAAAGTAIAAAARLFIGACVGILTVCGVGDYHIYLGQQTVHSVLCLVESVHAVHSHDRTVKALDLVVKLVEKLAVFFGF